MNVEIFLSSGMWLISRGPSVCWLFGSSDVVERNFEQNKMNQTNAVQGYIFFKNAGAGGGIIFVPWAKFGAEYWYSGYFHKISHIFQDFDFKVT